MANPQSVKRLGLLSRQVLAPTVTAAGEHPTKGVLDGLKVLDLSTVIAAPTCAAYLADLGADVIKIERPGEPDVVRTWGLRDDPKKTASPELFEMKNGGSSFAQFNRGKRALALDIGKPEGQSALKRMLKQVDIFITNVRGKSLQKLGLDYETLRDSGEYPKLIYAHLSAWGRTGPQVDDPGFDVGAWWARSGIMELARSSDDSPMPRQVGGIGDSVLATQLVGFIGLALYQRQITGEGQLIDAALLRSGIAACAFPISSSAGGGKGGLGGAGIRENTIPGKRKTTVTYFPFRCKCGQWIQFMDLVPARALPKMYKAFGITELELLGDPASRGPDGEWQRSSSAKMDQIMQTKTWEEWKPIFKEHDIWHAVINKFEDVMMDEQAIASGAFVNAPDVRHPVVAVPLKLSKSKSEPKRRAPKFGEHTTEVLREFGFTPEEESELRSKVVVQ